MVDRADIVKFAGQSVIVESPNFPNTLQPPAYLLAESQSGNVFYFAFEDPLNTGSIIFQVADPDSITRIEDTPAQPTFSFSAAGHALSPRVSNTIFYSHNQTLYAGSPPPTFHGNAATATPSNIGQTGHPAKPAPPASKDYPHTCPNCGAPSYNSTFGGQVDCSRKCMG